MGHPGSFGAGVKHPRKMVIVGVFGCAADFGQYIGIDQRATHRRARFLYLWNVGGNFLPGGLQDSPDNAVVAGAAAESVL